MTVTAPLFEKLLELAARGNTSFHVPGHKNGRAYTEYSQFAQLLNIDLTELPGLDDLHQPEGVIAQAQQMAARCFFAEHTFFLVNGSTVGNLALIMSVCQTGDLILVQRNAHQSILHGCMLANVRVVFLTPEWDEESGIPLHVSEHTIARAVQQFPEAKVVFLTNPTYYGATQDLRPIAELVHQANMLLLVDEAHGAHLGYHPAWPRSAMQSGADAAVQSTHKMLASMTMSGMLHVQGTSVDCTRLQQVLRMLESSSPSYVLMASLDLARARLEERGEHAFSALKDDIDWFQQQLRSLDAPFIQTVQFDDEQANCVHDPCKIILKMSGMTGHQLQQALHQHGCMSELADHQHVLLVLSIETTRADLQALLYALSLIASKHKSDVTTNPVHNGIINLINELRFTENMEPISLSLDWLHEQKINRYSCRLEECLGLISAQVITPYPPGIPLLFPGDKIQQSHLQWMQMMIDQGMRIHGLTIHQGQPFIEVLTRNLD
jgi:arginine/lysine/ornithine decarboxylase